MPGYGYRAILIDSPFSGIQLNGKDGYNTALSFDHPSVSVV